MADETRNSSSLRAGLRGRCPRCGEGRLFQGPLTLKLRERCDMCGLNYGFADSGDGPAVFVIIILGFLIMGAALVVEFKVSPPLWVHLVLWAPLTAILAFSMLRPMKAMLVVLQYRHRADQAHIAEDER